MFFSCFYQIDTLSKVNHKNFVSLLGYCEEEDPFTRMMVFEYAPNGTLFEHLHSKFLLSRCIRCDLLNTVTQLFYICMIELCRQYLYIAGKRLPAFGVYSDKLMRECVSINFSSMITVCVKTHLMYLLSGANTRCD